MELLGQFPGPAGGMEPSGEQPARPEAPASRSRSEVDLLLPLAAAICVVLGWYIFLDYERIVLELVGQGSILAKRIWVLRWMLILVSVGGLGLAFLASREARRRRLAESQLERLNAELARRVVRRTAMRTKALPHIILAVILALTAGVLTIRWLGSQRSAEVQKPKAEVKKINVVVAARPIPKGAKLDAGMQTFSGVKH